jgi:hypothetical protein
MAKSIYIAGPMSGYPELNFPAFYEAEEFWTECGYNVFNPANKDAEKELDPVAFATGDHVKANSTGFNFKEAYLWDVTKVIEADAIYMLKGWQYSPGAVGEHAVAVAMKKHNPEYEIIYGE